MPNNPQAVDPGARQIINANIGLTNIIPFTETQKQIIDALDTCYGVLKQHCGPHSGYAMILEDKGVDYTFTPSHFTRDGIRILKALDMMSPLERYFKDILTYIGERVDQAAHDGTTTTMMIAAHFLELMLKKTEELEEIGLTTVQKNTIAKQFFDELQTFLDCDSWTVEDVANDLDITELEAAGKIAFCQALSSSGGNYDLAVAMKQIFERSPRSTWETIEHLTSKKETGNAYTVEIEPFEAKLRCVSSSRRALNSAMGTECVLERSTVIVLTQAMMQGDFTSGEVMDYIQKLDSSIPVTLIAPMVDGTFTAQLDGIDRNREAPINSWQYSPEEQIAGQAFPWELTILLAKAGCSPWEDDQYEGPHTFTADVHWKDTYMHLNNFIAGATQDSVLHPMYNDPDTATPFYTACLTDIQNQLKEYEEGHRPDGAMRGHFVRMLNKLTCLHRPKLRLGGPIHEQLANLDVVEDVEGAIMSGLNHGFLVNGLGSALQSISELTYQKIKQCCKEASFAKHIAMSLKQAAEALYTHLIINNSTDKISRGSNEYSNAILSDVEMPTFDDYLKDIDTINQAYLESHYPPLQPVVVYLEMCKRIQELVIKIISANMAIVFGGVMLQEGDDGNSGSK